MGFLTLMDTIHLGGKQENEDHGERGHEIDHPTGYGRGHGIRFLCDCYIAMPHWSILALFGKKRAVPIAARPDRRSIVYGCSMGFQLLKDGFHF